MILTQIQHDWLTSIMMCRLSVKHVQPNFLTQETLLNSNSIIGPQLSPSFLFSWRTLHWKVLPLGSPNENSWSLNVFGVYIWSYFGWFFFPPFLIRFYTNHLFNLNFFDLVLLKFESIGLLIFWELWVIGLVDER